VSTIFLTFFLFFVTDLIYSLAYAELYLTLAIVISRFNFELFETTIDDVKLARDFFVGIPKLGSKGIRARIKPL